MKLFPPLAIQLCRFRFLVQSEVSSYIAITLIGKRYQYGTAASSIFHGSSAMEELSRSFAAAVRRTASHQPHSAGSRGRTRAEAILANETQGGAHTRR